MSTNNTPETKSPSLQHIPRNISPMSVLRCTQSKSDKENILNPEPVVENSGAGSTTNIMDPSYKCGEVVARHRQEPEPVPVPQSPKASTPSPAQVGVQTLYNSSASNGTLLEQFVQACHGGCPLHSSPSSRHSSIQSNPTNTELPSSSDNVNFIPPVMKFGFTMDRSPEHAGNLQLETEAQSLNPASIIQYSLPFKVHYHILTILTRILETVSFTFCQTWFPEILSQHEWDCPEAAECHKWCNEIFKVLVKTPADMPVFNDSEQSNNNNTNKEGDSGNRTRPSVLMGKQDLGWLNHELGSRILLLRELRQDYILRRKIGSIRLIGYLEATEKICQLLGEREKANQVLELTKKVNISLSEIVKTQEEIHTRLSKKMDEIRKKKAELEKEEREIIYEAQKEIQTETLRIGWNLNSAFELEKFYNQDPTAHYVDLSNPWGIYADVDREPPVELKYGVGTDVAKKRDA